MTMIKFYYYGVPVCMFAQTVLMLYMREAVIPHEQGNGRKVRPKLGHDNSR